MADSVRRRLRQTTHSTRGAVLTGARWLGRQEASVLVAALCILLALFGFIKISEELGEGKLAHLDDGVLHLLRVPGAPHPSIGPSWLLEATQDITSLGRRSTLRASLARFAARRHTKVYLLTVALVATFLIGSGRVYLGVHYPSDVLAGWCAGLVWALTCWLVARYWQARGAVGKTGA